MIRRLRSGEYRLFSAKKDARTGRRRNLGTFKTLEAAKQHERCGMARRLQYRPQVGQSPPSLNSSERECHVEEAAFLFHVGGFARADCMQHDAGGGTRCRACGRKDTGRSAGTQTLLNVGRAGTDVM